MQESKRPQLDYAPRVPTHRRNARRILLAATILFLGFDAALFLPIAIRRIHLLALQRKCLTYIAAPDSIVFDSRSSSMPQLPRSNPDLKNIPLMQGTALVRIPAIWNEYFMSTTLSALLNCAGTPYLHHMQSPKGHDRLVTASVFTYDGDNLELSYHVLEPAGLKSSAHLLGDSRPDKSLRLTTDAANVVIYAGQPDPQHLDHFTIHANLNGTERTIDGWLLDDDTVTFEFRKFTPSAPPSPASSR